MMAEADHLRSGEAGGDASQTRIDFLDAERVFAGLTYTIPDQRFPYPEERFITVGLLSGRMVIVVWTPTEEAVRKLSCSEAARASRRTLWALLSMR